MRALYSVRLAAIPALALLSASCFGGGSAPEKLLTLTPSQVLQPGATRTASADQTIAVLTPSVPQSINTRRIPVYVTPISIEYLVNATYVEEPHHLFRRVLAETIAARTGQLVLDPGNFTQEAAATLSGQMLQYGFEPATMQVVVSYEAALARGTADLRTQRFEARVPVTTQDVTTIAPALNQAANQVAEQVAAWIGG